MSPKSKFDHMHTYKKKMNFHKTRMINIYAKLITWRFRITTKLVYVNMVYSLLMLKDFSGFLGYVYYMLFKCSLSTA